MEQLASLLEKVKIRSISNEGIGGLGKEEERRAGEREESEKLDTMKDNMINFLYNL